MAAGGERSVPPGNEFPPTPHPDRVTEHIHCKSRRMIHFGGFLFMTRILIIKFFNIFIDGFYFLMQIKFTALDRDKVSFYGKKLHSNFS
jgi:hypothetical protein